MNKVVARKNNRAQRQIRVRSKISGTSSVPRISVFRSNRYIYAQIIDDTKGATLIDISKEVKDLHAGKAKIQASFELGKELAKKAITKKIKKVVFDRGGYRYHGRIKSLADGAREGGLEF